jgi:hypothetical protein
MNNILLKNKLLTFIIFNIFFSIFYLYSKHEVGNDTSISEWLINYQGGFTRRGLGGEINIFLSNFFSLPLRKSIFFFQATIHTSYLLLVMIYFKNLRLNILQIFAFFSPIFLLYPIAEIESLGRKEILICLCFISILILCEKKIKTVFINLFVGLTFPILCLIWEEVVLFAPFFAVILIVKNKFVSFKEVFINLIIIFFPSILVMSFIFLNPLTSEGHAIMCDYLQKEFAERCYMSANLLIRYTIYFDSLSLHNGIYFFPNYFRYIIVFLLGFLPLHLLLIKNEFKNDDNFITKNFNLVILFICLYLPIILLFVFGGDWGRWIHLTYSISILLYFYLLKNSIISNKFYDNSLSRFFLNKKKLLIFLFVIFAFYWSPKTHLIEDVSTNTLYKIVYKSSKLIFNFEGVRIFQDNPLIKFHKKYIE